jgi:histidinol-phosphatase (PHP family)
MYHDYHTHTLYSNHGEGHPRELAQFAVERGLLALGFSEHFPLPHGFSEPTGGLANMHWGDIDSYIQEVNQVKAEFGDKIKIMLGFEVDYLPSYHNEMQTNLARYPAEYWVGSVHIVDRFRSDHENWLIDFSEEDFAEGIKEKGYIATYTRYFELVRQFAQSYHHQIVGHFDLVKKYNKFGRYFELDTAHYLSQAEMTLDVLKQTNKIIEVNTAGLFKGIGEIYPSDPILQMILHRRIPICLSSDAHKPEHVAREFSSVWQRLSKLGFEQLTAL